MYAHDVVWKKPSSRWPATSAPPTILCREPLGSHRGGPPCNSILNNSAPYSATTRPCSGSATGAFFKLLSTIKKAQKLFAPGCRGDPRAPDCTQSTPLSPPPLSPGGGGPRVPPLADAGPARERACNIPGADALSSRTVTLTPHGSRDCPTWSLSSPTTWGACRAVYVCVCICAYACVCKAVHVRVHSRPI